uniref:G_PROTEIN_RECEP_F1_2 domain-containing protein n=1 Tax=Heterorhabditis bacteriophora TaxID=37862 RepID=A0A1I7WLV5_HETBA
MLLMFGYSIDWNLLWQRINKAFATTNLLAFLDVLISIAFLAEWTIFSYSSELIIYIRVVISVQKLNFRDFSKNRTFYFSVWDLSVVSRLFLQLN